MSYEIRQEPFIGTPPLPPYSTGGRYGDINGNLYTHAIYDGNRLIFRASSRKHANTLLARLRAVHAIETATR